MADRLEQALEECLELLRQGVSLEECLTRYPEDAEELEPLLRTAQVARHRLTFGVPARARARIRARVIAEWDQEHAPREQHWRLPAFVPRWAVVTACVVLALLLAGAGTVTAAGGTVPGDLLYPVKMATEEVRLALTFSDLAKAELHVDLAEQRVDEIRKLVERGEPEKITQLAARVVAHLEEADRVVAIGDEGIAELKAHLERSATVQLAKLEQILLAAPPEAKTAVQDALVTSGEGYGMTIEVAASSAPAPALLAQAGTIQIFVTDPPPPDVDHVWVEVEDIEVHRAAGPDSRWITIVDEPERFDLVAIVGVQEFIGSKDIDTGFYTQLRMNVTRATVVVGEEEHDAFLPSGSLKFIRPFQVKDGEITRLVLDFDGDRSIIITGTGWYILKPVVMLLVPGQADLPEEVREEEIEEVEIEGTIEDFVEGQWLRVAGQKVLINGDTEIEGTLDIGLSCEVKAIPQDDGTLLAINIKMEEAGRPEEAGPPEDKGLPEKPGPPEEIGPLEEIGPPEKVGPPEEASPPEEAGQGGLPSREENSD